MTRPSLLIPFLVAWPLTATAQVEVPCPVDKKPIRISSAPWNLAGGIDSDGCGYAIDAQGAQRVVGLGQVALCSTCFTALRRDHLGRGQITPEVANAIKAVVERLRKGWPKAKSLPPGRRHELAAAIYAEVGLAPFNAPGDKAAIVAELLLRAAWAARGRAVLGGPDGGYRPRTPAEARAQLEALDRRVRHDPSRDPAVRTIEAQLEALDEARTRLTRLGRGGSLDRRLRALRALAQLRTVEGRLLVRKQDLLKQSEAGEGRLSDRELRLAQVRAWIRAGEPASWKPALAALEQRRATYATARLIRESCVEEERLLKLAEAQLLKAKAASKSPTEQARLLFLAGDAARRRGADAEARERLGAALRIAPKSPAGRRAAMFLER